MEINCILSPTVHLESRTISRAHRLARHAMRLGDPALTWQDRYPWNLSSYEVLGLRVSNRVYFTFCCEIMCSRRSVEDANSPIDGKRKPGQRITKRLYMLARNDCEKHWLWSKFKPKSDQSLIRCKSYMFFGWGRLFKNKPLPPQWRLHPVLFGALVRSCLSFWGLLERASRPGCPANTYFGAARPWVGSRCPALWFFLHYPSPEPAWKITYFTKGLRYSSRNVWPTEVRSTSTSMASMVSKPSKHDWFETLSSREYCACDRTLSPKSTQTW